MWQRKCYVEPWHRHGEPNMAANFKVGDCVVYRKPKVSVHPGQHARDIRPAAHGDHYDYAVDKFYRVIAVLADHKITVLTKRGRRHTLAASDPALRRAYWWERLLWRRSFPPFPAAQA
jgi:hypothetical protein